MEEDVKPAFLGGVSLMNKCKTCGNDIKVTIFRGLGYCSETCRKIQTGEK